MPSSGARETVRAVVAARARVSRRHVADLGIDLPRDQIRAHELSAVLPNGLAVSRRRHAAARVDAIPRPSVADAHRMAQRGDHWHFAARERHGFHGVLRANGGIGVDRGVHRDHSDHRDGNEPAVRHQTRPSRAVRHASRRRRCADVGARRSVHGVADGARRDHDRLRELVARQRAEPSPAARARCDGLRERDALRQRDPVDDRGRGR